MVLKQAIAQANELRSKIDANEMRQLQGLSSPKVRHLLNNLVSGATSYLEIGCYLGGTLGAALCGNQHVYAVAIDDFSMMPNKRQMFFDNTINLKFNFFEEDSFKFDVSKITQPIEVYFYDGCHTFEAQYKALQHFIPAMAKDFIYVCDDWAMKKIPNATFTAAKHLQLEVLEKYDLLNTPGTQDWWGGLGVIKFRKP